MPIRHPMICPWLKQLKISARRGRCLLHLLHTYTNMQIRIYTHLYTHIQACLLQSCVRLPSRLKLVEDIWRHVAATLRSPAASPAKPSVAPHTSGGAPLPPQQQGEGAGGPEATPRGSRCMVKVEGRHGAGVSVLLAQVAERIERECAGLGFAGGCHVIYFRALPGHARSYLLWYLCSAVSMTTAVRPTWRVLSDLLIRRSLDQTIATMFVLDGITPADAQSLSEVLAATRQAGGMALAIFALQSVWEALSNPLLGQLSPSPISGAGPGAPTPAAAAPQPPPLACVAAAVGELPPMETRLLVSATLRTLAAAGTGAGSDAGAGTAQCSVRGGTRNVVPAAFVGMCEDKILYALERHTFTKVLSVVALLSTHTRALTFENFSQAAACSRRVCGAAAVLERGVSAGVTARAVGN